jgi:transcriptional antiterminator RfaH
MWYALQAHTGHEERVSAQLALEGAKTYWPSISRSIQDRHNPRHTIPVRRSLFPGYLFISLADGRLHSATRCIIGVVGFGGDPAPIPDSQIDSVRILETSPSVQRCCPALDQLRSCPEVYVREGPLAGVQGKVLRLGKGTRVLVSVSGIGQSISAEVEAEWLEIRKPAVVR